MEKEFKAELLNCANISLKHKILSVLVTKTDPGWFFDKTYTLEQQFTFLDGVWMDQNSRAVLDTSTRLRLTEMLVNLMIEDKLDRYIATL